MKIQWQKIMRNVTFNCGQINIAFFPYIHPFITQLCCLQRRQWHVKRRTDISPTTRTRRTAPCTTCARVSVSTTCRAPPTSSSTPTRTCATGPRTWRGALSTRPRRPPAGGDSRVRLNAPHGRESAERTQTWRQSVPRTVVHLHSRTETWTFCK